MEKSQIEYVHGVLEKAFSIGGLDLGTERNILSGMGIRLSLEISG